MPKCVAARPRRLRVAGARNRVLAAQPRDARPGARPRVVIVGGGFGGMHAAQNLKHADADVTIVDRTNHFVFQPLLYQVATAVLAPTDVTTPIRYLLRKQKNAEVLMADVREIDAATRTVYLDDARTPLGYDYLIVAAGARHSYFGHDRWEQDAPGLKTIADAYEIRRRFLLAFEEAEKAETPEARAEWLTFVIIGGGPTGAELAGMIPATAETFRKDFRRIDTAHARVILLEASPHVLAAYPESLAEHARRDLEALGVEVRTGTSVTRVEAGAVYVGDERIPARTIFWGAGNAASPLGKQLGVAVDRAGRVPVGPDLSVPGRPEVFVVGDLAAFTDRGNPVPGVAQGAIQMGRHAARNLRATLEGKARTPFHYWNKGDVATIGRHKAVASIGPLKLTGALAWWLWACIHVLYLAGFRNRIVVLIQWGYAYLTYHRGDGRVRGPEHARDLGRRQVVLPAERHREPPPLGEGGERARDGGVQVPGVERVVHVGRGRPHRGRAGLVARRRTRGGVLREARGHPVVPQVVERVVAHGGVEPRARRARHVPRGAVAPESEEHVVHDPLGGLGRPHIPVGEAPERLVVAQVERLARGLVARAHADDPRRLRVFGGRGRRGERTRVAGEQGVLSQQEAADGGANGGGRRRDPRHPR